MRPGRGRRCEPIRTIVPTRSRVRGPGLKPIVVTGCGIGRHIPSKQSVTGYCSGSGTDFTVHAGLSRWTEILIAKMDASGSGKQPNRSWFSGQFWLVPEIAKMDAIKVNIYRIAGC